MHIALKIISKNSQTLKIFKEKLKYLFFTKFVCLKVKVYSFSRSNQSAPNIFEDQTCLTKIKIFLYLRKLY